jgi:hypothetical protein
VTHPVPTFIYHITHVDNLPGIVAAGGLYCKAQASMPAQRVNVSHYDLQERRGRCIVTCGPGGNLHDYVPFYFAPRSPMLYALYRGNVAGYQGGQTPIVYLVASAQRIHEREIPFVFSDGHPIMALSRFYERLEDLDYVDWEVMAGRYWNDTIEHPNRKQLRQAEFLVLGFFPWDCVDWLAVRTQTMEAQVRSFLEALPSSARRPVRRMPQWYF